MTPSDRIAQLEAELETARRDADNERSTREALDREIFRLKSDRDFWFRVASLFAEDLDSREVPS